MKIDENAPATMPTSSARPRSCNGFELPMTPASSIAVTGSTPMTVVFTERTNTWLMARLACCEYVLVLCSKSLTFSRTLSNTTTVS